MIPQERVNEAAKKTRFEVEVKYFIYVEAENLQVANQRMQSEYPDLETVDFYDLDKSESNLVIGHCEMSGLSIFKGDNFTADLEGVMILNNESNDSEREG